jgi:predicted heme/steroid binding protein
MKRVIITTILGLSLIITGCSGNQQKNQNITKLNTKTAVPNKISTTQQRTFTLDELKKYNGKNGNPAYVAVNGVVYDVTNSRLWKNGLHSDCSDSTYAGADFSQLINSSPHGPGIMKRMPVVGKLK